MIDYVPNDIPKAIIKFADENLHAPDGAKVRWFRYLKEWNGLELYAMDWSYNEPLNTGLPQLLIYDCHDARRATKEEFLDIQKENIIVKYVTSFPREKHLCHLNKKAFNMHTKENDYNIKVKHISPKYIPKEIIEYADNHYKDSLYPGADKRLLKYLTTWENYEVYILYWNSKKYKRKSTPRLLMYDGKNVKRADIEEWKEILNTISDTYHGQRRPYLYNKD